MPLAKAQPFKHIAHIQKMELTTIWLTVGGRCVSTCLYVSVCVRLCACTVCAGIYIIFILAPPPSLSACVYSLPCIQMLIMVNSSVHGCIMTHLCVTNSLLNTSNLHGSTSGWLRVLVNTWAWVTDPPTPHPLHHHHRVSRWRGGGRWSTQCLYAHLQKCPFSQHAHFLQHQETKWKRRICEAVGCH